MAAEQGDAEGQYCLGLLYATGKGVPQNYILAHMWFDLASAAGNEEATIHRDQAATLMMPLQLLEARKLAREWQPASAN